MARTQMKFYGAKIQKQIHAEMKKRLFKAGVIYSREAKIKMSGAYEVKKKVKGGGTEVTRSFSTIDEYPKKRTGHLRRNITFEIGPLGRSGRWGTNVEYGKWLELGTRNMPPRPWMTLTNKSQRAKVRRMMNRPMPKRAFK